MLDSEVTTIEHIWFAIGIIGGVLFFTRFYVQWIASEIKKRSVVPVVFWYQSSIGSVLLLAYGVASQSPIGTLGQSLNLVIYSRNLIHIWREKGTLSQRRNVLVHIAVAVIVLVAVALVAWTWYREYRIHQHSDSASQAWIWLAIGLIGQALFACRFMVQWIATERAKKSVVPSAFWYLSIAASVLVLCCFIQRGEWVFAVGNIANVFIYMRNLWLIRRERLNSGPETT